MTLKKIVYVLVPILLVFTLVIAGSSCASNKNYRYKPPKKKKKKDCDCSDWSYNIQGKEKTVAFPVSG